MGQYGKILKLVVNRTKAYNPNSYNGPSYSAYVSYSSSKEAALAVLGLDNVVINDHLVRASFGTTKYCMIYLQNSVCKNKDCLYLHKVSDDLIMIDKVAG